MRVIGFTGGSGCGKTTALRCLAPYDVLCIDCDALYHEMLRTDAGLTAAIGAAFPAAMRGGALDRRALGEIVFSDPRALARLNAVTDPAVCRRVEALLERARAEGRRVAAVDAIRLLESGLGAKCDVTIAVTAPEEQRVRRLQAREGISEEYARMRIRAQRSDASFSAACDYTLENTGDLDAFQGQCRTLFQTICKE